MVAIATPAPTAPTSAATGSAPAKMSAKKVNLWYGQKQALFDVDLDIADRQVTALIGPSGCAALRQPPPAVSKVGAVDAVPRGRSSAP